jgi:hypothetical protein
MSDSKSLLIISVGLMLETIMMGRLMGGYQFDQAVAEEARVLTRQYLAET